MYHRSNKDGVTSFMNLGKHQPGILLDSDQIPVWIYHSIEQVDNFACFEFPIKGSSVKIENSTQNKRCARCWR
jgi:hypothetical protein